MKPGHGGNRFNQKIIYDFSANINPLGMPEACCAALQAGIKEVEQYPDFYGGKLRRAIGKAEGVRPEQVILGNGASELIYALCYALRPKRVLLSVPAFSEYEAAAAAAGGKVCYWKLREETNFSLSSEIIGQLAGTELMFLGNPGNPTGALTKPELLSEIAKRCEQTGTVLCVDECFLPFLEKEEQLTLKHRIREFPHLFILRAFTKIYGMPGLRLGYGLTANEELAGKMRDCLPPWNTSVPAQNAGLAALTDGDFLERTRRLIRQERDYLLEEMSGGLADKIYHPEANFIFFKARTDLYDRLLEQGILIRACGDYPGLEPGYFRIAVRGHEENAALIEAWKKL